MMKKYLTKASLEDKREAEEFTLLAGLDTFCIVFSNKRDSRRLVIPYTHFTFPQFINEDAIYEELKERIQEFFNVQESNKLIILCSSAAEELRIKQIIIDNKMEFRCL